MADNCGMTSHGNLDPDIQEAVEQASSNASENFAWYARLMKEVPYRPPLKPNRILWMIWFSRCLSWGITSALWKIGGAARKHPWMAVLGLGGAVAMCPVCVYSTGCIIGGLAIWAVKTESDTEKVVEATNPVGEFMQ